MDWEKQHRKYAYGMAAFFFFAALNILAEGSLFFALLIAFVGVFFIYVGKNGLPWE